MWPFSSGGKDTYLVVDMGSASVGAAVVVLESGSVPSIVYRTRVPLAIRDRLSWDQYARTMSSYLSQAILRVSKHAERRLKQAGAPRSYSGIQVMFASPWFTTSIHTVTEQFPAPQPVTEALLTEITENAVEAFQKEAADVLQSRAFSDGARVIEHERTGIRINGYQVEDPYDKEANDLTMTLFLSAVPDAVSQHVEQTIGEYADISDMTMRSQSYVTSTVITSLLPISEAFFIDVGGDRTEVAIMQETQLRHVYSFDVGVNDLVRAVANVFGTGNELAASYLRLHESGFGDETFSQQVEKAVSGAIEQWQAEYKKVRASMKSEGFGSRRGFVLTYGTGGDRFRRSAEEHHTSEQNAPDLYALNQENLAPFVSLRDDRQFDSHLVMEALFVALQNGYSVPDASQQFRRKVS